VASRAQNKVIGAAVTESWTSDRARCRQTGIPEDAGFATKPELAGTMIGRAIAAGVPFGWVAADEAYGQNAPLRDWLEEHHVSHVLAVPKSFPVVTGAGKMRARELAAAAASDAVGGERAGGSPRHWNLQGRGRWPQAGADGIVRVDAVPVMVLADGAGHRRCDCVVTI
jgi:SRSO17 transposase